MFGARAFGATYFAQAGGTRVRPPKKKAGIGGSGIPADWHERIRKRPPLTEAEEEMRELLSIGAFD